MQGDLLPGDDLSRAGAHSEEGEERKDHGNAEAPNRNTLLSAFA
jgi:hypothetical protein